MSVTIKYATYNRHKRLEVRYRLLLSKVVAYLQEISGALRQEEIEQGTAEGRERGEEDVQSPTVERSQ